MKKNLLSVIAVVCAATALAVSVYTCVCANTRIKAQDEQIAALISAAEASAQPTEPADCSILSWQLEPQVWADGTGADIRLTAVTEGSITGAQLEVMLMDEPYGLYPCQQDGSTLTATAGVEIENGYAYTLLLTAADGTVTRLSLTSPADSVDPLVVNLMDSLSFYSNLLVDGWTLKSDSLFISGYAQAQLPQISPDSAELEAALCLMLNGESLQRCGIELVPGEGSGSFETEFSNSEFGPLPELREGDTLELWLEVSIGSQTDSVCGASWYLENGELLLTAG